MIISGIPRNVRQLSNVTCRYVFMVVFGTFVVFSTMKLDSLNTTIDRTVKTVYRKMVQPTAYIVFGTRPEVIKLAPIIKEMIKSKDLTVKTVFTGQHMDIIEKYLDLFDVRVDIRLSDTFTRGQTLTMLLGKIMLSAVDIPLSERDIWIVQGDTSSALAVAMFAFHNHIRIAHVEAGLRTFHMYLPFPEEFNRKTISSISTFNFAPTSLNANNLLGEGISKDRIFITGNTVIDTAKFLNENGLLKMPSSIKSFEQKQIVLVTIHRRENLFRSNELYRYISLSNCSECIFTTPVHPNPNAKKAALNICQKDSRFICVSPLPYEELHWVLKHAAVVLTDSGGIQKKSRGIIHQL